MAGGHPANPIFACGGSSGLSGETFNYRDSQLSQHIGEQFPGLGHGSSGGNLSDLSGQLQFARLDGTWRGRKEPLNGAADRPLRDGPDCV
jgi:hypothetical protein